MAEPAAAPVPDKRFKRRDDLLAIQAQMQETWAETKPFERDAPNDGTKDKYMCTFPYPYMNGRLHIGHAFSLTKTEFSVRYNRLKGKNALWPFGLHCTGMPIQAAAQRVEEEMKEFGNPPVFPVEEKAAAPVKGQKSKVAAKTVRTRTIPAAEPRASRCFMRIVQLGRFRAARRGNGRS